MHDDDRLCKAGDRIDNAVFDAIQALCVKDIEWDMHHIGDVTLMIEKYLADNGFDVCHPWQDEDENICYSGNDRCPYCKYS